MRTNLVSALLPLILAGCNYSPSTSINTTMISTTTINGVDVLDSAIRESASGNIEFTCNDSASGRCYYAVFTSDCRDDAKTSGVNTCTTQRFADFAVAKGESKSLSNLPSGYRHCVARSTPVPPYCTSAPQG